MMFAEVFDDIFRVMDNRQRTPETFDPASEPVQVASLTLSHYMTATGALKWVAEYSQPVKGRMVPRCIRHTATTPEAALQKVATTLGKVGI